MESFWDHSWAQADPDRIAQYIQQFDMKEDPIIAELLARQARTVCDAGCGCGIYLLKLLSHGFTVSGFDVSVHAVDVARRLQERSSLKADLKAANILSTGYEANCFDAVISRDVIDHMGKRDARAAVAELLRITKPGGIVFMTLDHLDSEYETEPHIVNDEGDYVFTDGKWKGMVFHSYAEQEIRTLIPSEAACEVVNTEDELVVRVSKRTGILPKR